MRWIVFVVSLLLTLFMPSVGLAGDVNVKLIWKYPEAGWLEIESRQGEYQLQWDDQKLTLPAGKSFRLGQIGLVPFLWLDQKLIILENKSVTMTSLGDGILKIREPGKDWNSYRGDLKITRDGIFWSLINTLDQEQYLKGVVPIEMSNSWAAKGFEALKAQAAAARTYLLKNMDSSRTITDSPNIHQAYLGRSVEGAASLAVEQTAGQILVDRQTGAPIAVYYSAHNGGYTEETQNVWKSHDPHYPSFPDPFSQGIGGYVNQWRFTIAADALGGAFGLAPIRNIRLEKLKSGRVFRVHLADWLGNEKTVTGGEFVQKFYPYDRSINKESFLGRLFDVRMIVSRALDRKEMKPKELLIKSLTDQELSDNPGPRLSRLISSNEGISDEPRPYSVFVFNGSGWGHGVGMSQWGAYNMAQQGYSYEDILRYYYRNAALLRR